MRLLSVSVRSCVFVAGVLAVGACQHNSESRVQSTPPAQPPTAEGVNNYPFELELGEKIFVDSEGKDEDYWVDQLIEQSNKTVQKLKDTTGSARRSAHSKAHGCVTGTFTVNPDRPQEARFGIFKDDKTFPVWIRFSNATPTIQSDKIPDGRGMAVKVIGVEGSKMLPGEENSNAVDFPFVSGPIFPVADLKDYMALQQNLVGFLGTHPRSALLAGEVAARGTMKTPLQGTYWSMGAYKLGSQAVKFSTRPCQSHLFNIPLTVNPSFLRNAMIKQLTTDHKDACFEFGVQFQKDPRSMPVEDPTVEWRESATLFSAAERVFGGADPVSPFVTIATIKIPAQTFATDAQDQYCERMSFNPWRTLPVQRPLGNLMRARLKVYQASLSERQRINNAAPVQQILTGTQADVQ